ncbi:MAG: glycosyltransferase family 39 protein [Anaerolineae bacterium]|nr:glycosyltransferase family 39 protein [Anaerolineae bacterium]
MSNKIKMRSEKLNTAHKLAGVDPYVWLTLLLSLPVIGPLLQPGYFWGGHDARHSVYFLHQFDKVIRDGVWYPRWIPDMAFGYGYPFFNVYGPLASYAGEAFHLLGFNIVTSVKIVFGLSAVLSGLTMYLFVRRLLGRPAGLIAALTYVYLPYHLFDLYVRADLAESVAFVFVPLVLWGFYGAVTRPRLPALVGAALAYAALMFTHSLSAFILTAILGLYVAYMLGWQFWQNRRRPESQPPAPPPGRRMAPYVWRRKHNPYLALLLAGLPALFVLLLGLGLSAVYLLPALTEAGFVRTDQWFGGRFAFGDDFVEVFQLFSPQWGFGASIPGPDDQTGFQLGLAATVLFILSFWLTPKLVDTAVRRTLYFFQGVTLVMAFLTVPLSTPVWALLPLAQLVQFPWRLLVVVAPYISIAAGVILAGDKIQETETSPAPQPPFLFPLPVIILACLILLSSYPYVQAQVRDPKPTEGPVSEAALFRFQQSSDEMTGQTAWVRRIPNWSTLAEKVVRGGQISTKVHYAALPADNTVGVYSMEMDSQHELLWVGTEKEGQAVTFFTPYYPGWRAYVYEDLGPDDGNLDKEVGPVTRIGPVVDRPALSVTYLEGWLVVPIPPGFHFLEIRFEDTPVRIMGRWISFLSFLVGGGLLLASRRWHGRVSLLPEEGSREAGEYGSYGSS